MDVIEKLRTLSPADFATLGMSDLAYVKSVLVDGRIAYAIHAADGTNMAVVDDRGLAVAAIRQHDLEAVALH
ncbi:MAG TPA: DUF1150 family protein [Candidatus Sulfotelmatobacter sp.]|nr:DUF1150 family protein [Candidatus Sulfotelmatobacter sp.]